MQSDGRLSKRTQQKPMSLSRIVIAKGCPQSSKTARITEF
jgi:hypothetical protein